MALLLPKLDCWLLLDWLVLLKRVNATSFSSHAGPVV
jgi:hypothetical protein